MKWIPPLRQAPWKVLGLELLGELRHTLHRLLMVGTSYICEDGDTQSRLSTEGSELGH